MTSPRVILIGLPIVVYLLCAIVGGGQTSNLPYCLSIAGYTFACVNLLDTGVVLAIFVTLLSVGVLAGITILGSGISTEAQHILFVIAAMLILNGFVSALGIPYVLMLPYGLYAVGAFSAMTIIGTVDMASSQTGG